MKPNTAAIRIQRIWRRYIAPKCPQCFWPVAGPYRKPLQGYCTCSRCPGCLRFSDTGGPCSTECNPWFPPVLEDDEDDWFINPDEEMYERWKIGKPIHVDHLGNDSEHVPYISCCIN